MDNENDFFKTTKTSTVPWILWGLDLQLSILWAHHKWNQELNRIKKNLSFPTCEMHQEPLQQMGRGEEETKFAHQGAWPEQRCEMLQGPYRQRCGLGATIQPHRWAWVSSSQNKMQRDWVWADTSLERNPAMWGFSALTISPGKPWKHNTLAKGNPAAQAGSGTTGFRDSLNQQGLSWAASVKGSWTGEGIKMEKAISVGNGLTPELQGQEKCDVWREERNSVEHHREIWRNLDHIPERWRLGPWSWIFFLFDF